MRIALFTEVFPPKVDGITNRLRHTLRCLALRGHELRVFAPDVAEAEHPGARVIRIPGLPFPPYPGLRVTLPDPRIGLELARFRPDVVHAVGPACLGVWGIAAARALGLPVVASYHTDLPRYLPGYGLGFARGAIWPLLRRVHNAANLNLCPSNFTRRELRAHGIRHVGLWRGGVDTALFHPGRRSPSVRARLSGGRPEAPLLLYVGRLAREKRLETLGWVMDAIPEAHLALVGEGPDRDRLASIFARNPVHFAGTLHGEELAAAFASADVFVLPSDTETLGFVALEAMSSGCPVVAADAGGIPDLVEHGTSGLLFDPERPEDAVAAVRALLDDPARRRVFAEQARKFAEGCSWEAETGRLELAYAEAIRAQRRRSRLGRLRRLFQADAVPV
jgi:glycosyltransferase involved in cell wall biosynthesis